MSDTLSIPLTVIVPMYGVERFIGRCARSLLQQDVDGMEILFIDDCSPDRSADNVREIFAQAKPSGPSMRIIRMPHNSGLPAVRRRGILEARGRYIIHLDGDDWLDAGYYRALLDRAMETDADIVIGDEVQEFRNKTVPLVPIPQSVPSDGRDIIRYWYRMPLCLHCHNKLVRRSLYTDNDVLPYEGLDMWEDNGLFVRLFYFARKVERVTGPTYHYNRANQSAMTATYGSVQAEQTVEVARRLADFFASHGDAEDFAKTVAALQYISKLKLVRDSMDGYRRFKTLFPESDFIARELSPLAFSREGRLRFRMVRAGLGPLFVALYNVYSKIR